MFQSRYWLWHIKHGQGWSQTKEHERWDSIKPDFPEAMPVLGTMVLHSTLTASQEKLFDSIGPDVPF